MSIRNLAEAVILQSMSDLWSEKEREDSVKFFKGEGFRTCADLACLDVPDQIKLLTMVKDAVKHGAAKTRAKKDWMKQKSGGPGKISKVSNEPLSMAF